MKLKTLKAARPQQGAILIIMMVMLVLITLITVSSLRSTALDERMAGNARDRNKALQAAEAAVRACLLQATSSPATYPANKILLPTSPPTAANWDTDATWDTSGVDVTMTGAGLASNPRCLVENIGGGTSFRVTARAVGGSDLSIVMLQATYSAD